MVNKAFLGWKREAKGLRWSCASRPVLGLTGAAPEPKAAGEKPCPLEKCRFFLLPLHSLRKQRNSPITFIVKNTRGKKKKKVAAAVPGYWEDKIQALYSLASGGLRLSMNLLLQACDTAGSAVQEAPWVWSLDSISVNISPPKPLASLGPNDTMVLDPSKAATSSLISGSRVPPGCPWELSVSLQLGLFSSAGVCCCCSKNKMTV